MYGTPFRRRAFPEDAHDLNRSRAKNDSKLKRTFERIFEKYDQDFSDIGDEIDLETGEVIVDNGHLSGMRNERDTGSDPSRRFVRAFTQELGADDHLESWKLAELRKKRRQQLEAQGQEASRGIEVDDSEDELSSSPLRPSTPRQHGRRDATGFSNHELVGAESDTIWASPSKPQFDMRLLLQSMQGALGLPDAISALQAYGLGQPIDPATIQSLSVKIASQIATLLNGQLATPLVRPVRNDPWRFPSLSPHATMRQREFSFTPGPLYDTAGSLSPSGGASLWAFDDDFVESSQRAPKRQKIMNSIETDGTPGFEAVPTGTPEVIEQRAASAAEIDFICSARRNFYLLAHGVVNRGYLNDNDIENSWDGSPVDEEFTLAARRGPRQSGASTLHRFSRREDAMLIRLREVERWGWDEISAMFPDRSVGSLQVRYSRTLKTSGTRSHRNNIMGLVHDADLIASLPPRHFSKLDYALCSREPTAPRDASVERQGRATTKTGKFAGRPRRTDPPRSRLATEVAQASDLTEGDAVGPEPNEAFSLDTTAGPVSAVKDSNIDPQLLAEFDIAPRISSVHPPENNATAIAVNIGRESGVSVKTEPAEEDGVFNQEAEPKRKKRPAQKGPKESAVPDGDGPPRAKHRLPRNTTPREHKRDLKLARRKAAEIAERGVTEEDRRLALEAEMEEAALQAAKEAQAMRRREAKNARRRARNAAKREARALDPNSETAEERQKREARNARKRAAATAKKNEGASQVDGQGSDETGHGTGTSGSAGAAIQPDQDQPSLSLEGAAADESETIFQPSPFRTSYRLEDDQVFDEVSANSKDRSQSAQRDSSGYSMGSGSGSTAIIGQLPRPPLLVQESASPEPQPKVAQDHVRTRKYAAAIVDMEDDEVLASLDDSGIGLSPMDSSPCEVARSDFTNLLASRSNSPGTSTCSRSSPPMEITRTNPCGAVSTTPAIRRDRRVLGQSPGPRNFRSLARSSAGRPFTFSSPLALPPTSATAAAMHMDVDSEDELA